jgi:hypothetical protein
MESLRAAKIGTSGSTPTEAAERHYVRCGCKPTMAVFDDIDPRKPCTYEHLCSSSEHAFYIDFAMWVNYTANRHKKPSEKPHELASRLTIRRTIAR